QFHAENPLWGEVHSEVDGNSPRRVHTFRSLLPRNRFGRPLQLDECYADEHQAHAVQLQHESVDAFGRSGSVSVTWCPVSVSVARHQSA
ncbi:unnamed protein product, partial [Amoebophrya sp. A120]